jgi:hypothetical protein
MSTGLQGLAGGAWDILQLQALAHGASDLPTSLYNDIGFRTFRSGRRVLRKVLA